MRVKNNNNKNNDNNMNKKVAKKLDAMNQSTQEFYVLDILLNSGRDDRSGNTTEYFRECGIQNPTAVVSNLRAKGWKIKSNSPSDSFEKPYWTVSFK